MAPLPMACAPWVRSIDHNRREDTLHGSILKFG
jgi:hypothetical protein